MTQIKCENNTTAHKKSEIKLIPDDFREIIKIYGFRYNKKKFK